MTTSPACSRWWPTSRRSTRSRYKALAANIESGRVFARETEQVWQCRNCGYVYIGLHAPEKCPVCAHPKAYFELKSANY